MSFPILQVSIGPAERGPEFADLTGFPRERLFMDPANATYSALRLKKSVSETFFNINTPLAIFSRFLKDGAPYLREALSSWKPWNPPALDQALNQGGVVVFQGRRAVFSHYDPSTGSHADWKRVVATVNALPRR